jgi:hypothetical protein
MRGRWGFGYARGLFEDQFQPSGGGFLYRRSGKGAHIAVSADERARYVAAYVASWRYSFWGMMAAVLVLIAAET